MCLLIVEIVDRWNRLEGSPTIDGLDASPVIVWEVEVLCLKPLVEGGHDGRGVVGVLQTQSVAQLVDGHQEDVITCEKTPNKQPLFFFRALRFPLLPPLTPLVSADGPGLSEVKVRIPPNAVPREVGVSQESSLAIKRCAVAVEAVCEGQHDVRVLVHLVPYVAVRNLPEGERDHAFPDPEGFTDGFVRGPLAHLRGVVLYAGSKISSNSIRGN